MAKDLNLSERYINALRQLPQYCCNIDHNSEYLTHAMTGICIHSIPFTGIDDLEAFLEIRYPGGHKIEVHADQFLQLALKEAVEAEAMSSTAAFNILEIKTPEQKRFQHLYEHLNRKHMLNC